MAGRRPSRQWLLMDITWIDPSRLRSAVDGCYRFHIPAPGVSNRTTARASAWHAISITELRRTRSMHTKLKKSVLATACAAALLGLAAMPASATEWTGTSSNDWFDAGNWNPSAIPGATDPVVIDTIGSGVEIGAAGALADRVVVG